MSKTIEIDQVIIPLDNIDYIKRDYDYFRGFTIFLKSGKEIHCENSKLYNKVAEALNDNE